MMEISSKYDPLSVEDKWYSHWMKNDFFTSKPDDREPYTIVIPPPNVTGVLHMGHMLNNTIQDVLIRRARMQGKNACWVPGTDHASIATEAKVVNKLKEQGINKNDLSREEFLKHAWDWTDKHGGIILEQLKKLGASCDWSRTKFTLDDDLYESVIDVFIDLFNKGHIYRGVRMVNWDPKAKTALSDEEVVHKEVNSKLYHVKYKIEGAEEFITVATTRPETILGDTAVCVNPNDERYKNLVGKKVIVPLVNRSVPVISDEYVDIEFGTGCLKITPAHDINDYNIGIKHNLEVIDVLNEDGTISEAAGMYVGLDRFKARKQSAKDLEEQGLLVKVEDIKNKVGYSERTSEVIEPRLSLQWFLAMEKLSKPALDNVVNGNVSFHPPKFINTYKHWMENVKDWCISRQLWWGQRIPAWFYGKGTQDFVVAKTQEEALALAREKSANKDLQVNDLRQDEDVLDTWFSSWLWPISVFDGIRNPDNEDINYYYPTQSLVTAPEIMFFWVARMIIAGYEYRNELPFTDVYYTGIVRDKQGRKMSKSLGNSPDPIELMKKYGADGVRVGMLLSSPAGNDLLFDEGLCEQGRNFSNKIWNAFRLLKTLEVDDTIPQPKASEFAVRWMKESIAQKLAVIDEMYGKFRMSEALMETYKLVWDEFCAWYLEMVKPEYGKPIDVKTYNESISILEDVLKILHPFMPFITEEIWHLLRDREDKDCVIVAQWPSAGANSKLVEEFELVKDIISNIRNFRKSKNLSPKETVELFYQSVKLVDVEKYKELIVKLANVGDIKSISEKPTSSYSFMVKTDEFFIPFSENINLDEERDRIEKELEYQKGFLNILMKKLSNEKFVNNAPAQVVEAEKKKQADAEAKIKALEEQLTSLV